MWDFAARVGSSTNEAAPAGQAEALDGGARLPPIAYRIGAICGYDVGSKEFDPASTADAIFSSPGLARVSAGARLPCLAASVAAESPIAVWSFTLDLAASSACVARSRLRKTAAGNLSASDHKEAPCSPLLEPVTD